MNFSGCLPIPVTVSFRLGAAIMGAGLNYYCAGGAVALPAVQEEHVASCRRAARRRRPSTAYPPPLPRRPSPPLRTPRSSLTFPPATPRSPPIRRREEQASSQVVHLEPRCARRHLEPATGVDVDEHPPAVSFQRVASQLRDALWTQPPVSSPNRDAAGPRPIHHVHDDS